MRIKCICIFTGIIFSLLVKANPSDTLSLAKALIGKGKFRKAEKILAVYEQTHSNDLNTLWLHAQTAYWAGYNKTAQRIYTKAINQFPSNYYLKLDFARKLAENGESEKAKPLLELYRKYDPSSNDLRLINAKLAYWQGDYATALQLLNNESLQKDRTHETRLLKEEILAARSPWLNVNVDYLKDDQPLQSVTPLLEAGTYVNKLCSPSISLGLPLFSTDTSAAASPNISLGNRFQFFNTHAEITIRGGLVQLPDRSKTGIGSIEIKKTSFKYFQLAARIARQPYLVTVSSLSRQVVPFHFAGSAGWNQPSSWSGRVSLMMDRFTESNNSIYYAGAWLFTPPLKAPGLEFRLGYAYGYSHSKENCYIARESINTIVSNYLNHKTISGIYDPYFTPNHQHVHSVLLNISSDRNKKLVFGVNASIGFMGKTNDPYLFLDKDSDNNLFINKGYSTVNFYPNKVDAYVWYKLFSKFSIKATYSFLSNNFYKSHTAGISLIINFWNE